MRGSLRSTGTGPRRLRTVAAAGLTAALAVGLLAACGEVGGLMSPEPAVPTPSDTASTPVDVAPAVPSVDAVRTTGTAVEVDGTAVLHVLATDPAVQVRVGAAEGGAALTLDPVPPSLSFDVMLAAPVGAHLVPQDDDSIVVLADDGTFLGGMGLPLLAPGAAPTQRALLPDGAVRLSASGPLTAQVGAKALLTANWGHREGGRSLTVRPTPWARDAGRAGEVGAWTELVQAVPEADSQTMRDQLTCHALGAPDKSTWNLEPWRPDVGLLMTLAASCNPT